MKTKLLIYLCALACVCGACKDRKDTPMISPVQSICFDQESYLIDQGESLSLYGKLTIEPTAVADTATVIWRSSDESIATVSEYGTVRAKQKGEVEITATACGKSASCNVNVRAVFAISPNRLAIKEGFTYQMKANREQVTWSSSNEKIATISPTGLLTAVRAGTTEISAQYNGQTISADIQVSDRFDVTINNQLVGGDTYLAVKGETLYLSTTVGLDDVSWKYDLSDILTPLGDGNFRADKVGVVTINVSYKAMSCVKKIEVVYGAYKISSNQRVVLAPSNLQYCPATKKWRFAPNAYDICGSNNANYASSSYNGWIDLFDSASFKKCENNTISYDGKEYAVYSWETITYSMMNAILNTPYDPNDPKSTIWESQPNKMAKVNGVLGAIIYPADVQMPTWYSTQVYSGSPIIVTAEQWTELEQLGVTFFPRAGSIIYGRYVEEKDLASCVYWLDDMYTDYSAIMIDENYMYISEKAGIDKDGRYSVRLLKR